MLIRKLFKFENARIHIVRGFSTQHYAAIYQRLTEAPKKEK